MFKSVSVEVHVQAHVDACITTLCVSVSKCACTRFSAYGVIHCDEKKLASFLSYSYHNPLQTTLRQPSSNCLQSIQERQSHPYQIPASHQSQCQRKTITPLPDPSIPPSCPSSLPFQNKNTSHRKQVFTIVQYFTSHKSRSHPQNSHKNNHRFSFQLKATRF